MENLQFFKCTVHSQRVRAWLAPVSQQELNNPRLVRSQKTIEIIHLTPTHHMLRIRPTCSIPAYLLHPALPSTSAAFSACTCWMPVYSSHYVWLVSEYIALEQTRRMDIRQVEQQTINRTFKLINYINQVLFSAVHIRCFYTSFIKNWLRGNVPCAPSIDNMDRWKGRGTFTLQLSVLLMHSEIVHTMWWVGYISYDYFVCIHNYQAAIA